MTVSENAQQLISHANEYIQNGMGATINTGNTLAQAIQSLRQVHEVTSNSISRVSGLLGNDHPSTGPLTGLANVVQEKTTAVEAQIEQAIGALLDLDQMMTTYSNTMGSVGHVLLQGGN